LHDELCIQTRSCLGEIPLDRCAVSGIDLSAAENGQIDFSLQYGWYVLLAEPRPPACPFADAQSLLDSCLSVNRSPANHGGQSFNNLFLGGT